MFILPTHISLDIMKKVFNIFAEKIVVHYEKITQYREIPLMVFTNILVKLVISLYDCIYIFI